MREPVRKKEEKDKINPPSSSPKPQLLHDSPLTSRFAPLPEHPGTKGISNGNHHILNPPQARNQSIIKKPSPHISIQKMQPPEQEKDHSAGTAKILPFRKKEHVEKKEQIQPVRQSEPSATESKESEKSPRPQAAADLPSHKMPRTAIPAAETDFAEKTQSSEKSTQEEPLLKATEPGELIQQIITAPASRLVGAYNQGTALSENLLTLQTQEAQKSLPETALPTNPQGKEIQKKKRYRAKQRKAKDFDKTAEEKSKKQSNTDSSPKAEFDAVQEHKKQDVASSEISPEQHIDSIVLDSSKLPSEMGQRPVVSLAADSNPKQINGFRDNAATQVGEAGQDALKETVQDFGEDRIFPKKSTGVIKSSVILKKTENKISSALEVPAIPKEAAKGIDQEMGAVLSAGFEKEQTRYETAKEDWQQKTQKSHEDAREKITALKEGTENIQQEERSRLKSNISGYRKEWQDKITGVDKEIDNKAQNATISQQDKIKTEKEKGEKEADRHFTQAEKDAAAARKKAELDVEKEKKKKKNEAGGIIDWVVSKLSSLLESLKKAVSAIFNWLKQKVKQIFDFAKKLAMQAIESARRMIVGLIRGLGEVLKKLVSAALAAFPNIAKNMIAKIDKACNNAIQKVNQAAESLKKGVSSVLDFLADALQKALDFVQFAYMFSFNAIGMLIRGKFRNLGKYIFRSLIKSLGGSIQFLMRAMGVDTEAMDKIIDDPITFFTNFGKAVKQGVGKFLKNIGTHLKSGLLSWMFGVFEGTQIEFPKTFDAKGIFFLITQILGLTWASIRAEIVKRLGPKGETLMSRAETGIDFVKELITKGPVALWEKIREGIGDLKNMFFDTVIDWLKKTIVFEAFKMILSYITPVGAVVKAIEAIYKIVMFFHENWERIKDFVKTVYQSLSEIIAGKVSAAANYITSAMVKTVPIVIGFLARLLGFHNIVKPIRNVIQKISKPVKKARNKIIHFTVTKIKTLASKVGETFKQAGKKVKTVSKKAVKKIINWWNLRKKFKTNDGNTHELFFKGIDNNAQLMIASKPSPYTDFLSSLDIPPTMAEDRLKAVNLAKEIDETKYTESVKGDTKSETQRKKEEKAEKIETLLEKLRTITEGFFGIIPRSENPEYKPRNGNPFAIQTVIEKLTRIEPEKGKGTKPIESEQDVYDILNKRRYGEKNSFYYVRGHLLSQKLHGKGIWENMTPLLSKVNTGVHEKDVESKVKAGIDSGATLFYSVKADYGKQPNKEQLFKEIKQKDGMPDRELKKKIVEYEDYVPLSLECEAKSLETSRVKWTLNKKIDNPVDRKYDSYLLSGDRKAPIVVKMNSSTEKDFTTLPGIGNYLAQKIVEKRKNLQNEYPNKKAFSSYKDLKKVSGLGDAKIANMKAYAERIKKDFGLDCIDFEN